MRITPAALLGTVIATTLLAFGAGTATARTLSASAQNIRGSFERMEFVAGTVTNTCNVTLEGSIHARTIPKVINSLIGYITRIEVSSCNVATTVLTEGLPWHVKYTGFSGNLPNISLLIGKGQANVKISVCLLSAELTVNMIRNPSTGVVASATVPPQTSLPLTGILCPAPRLGAIRSNRDGAITALNSATLITVTLI